ncbi:TonB-dependent receptor [Pyxidicoccus fallax]|uniref:TonB-dependent receptor n=1 Tax=Pyxidicoccus fallax TaxID=394095 RepID=A0A848LH49_9BACT|nr:TonB-dependent receptor [Pyxidicoccus fallax]NPC81045.1 TonB-dependent receptor [Pyxidicoccus fallax]
MKGWLRAVGVLAACLALSAAGAEARGVIFGTVKEAGTGATVADVVITVTSPLLRGELTVVTDAQGRYRVPDLPPGSYTVRFEKEMFRPYARADVPLKEGHSTKLDVSLVAESLEDGIHDLACGPPTIDIGSTTTGRDLDLEYMLYRVLGRSSGSLDAVRTGEDLAPLVPGVLDVAGGLSIHGASVFENEYRLDDLSVRDAVLGVDALSPSTELIQAPELATGGYPAEYGRATGGQLEAMTRSGSNEMHGSVFAFWTPGLLEGRRASTGLGSQEALRHQGDFGATLGGPLLEDKLWFFAGVTPALSRVARTRQVPDSDGGLPRSFDDARSLQALGKLTYLINIDHHVALSLITAPSSQEGGSTDATRTSLRYDGAFKDKKLLVNVNAGWLSQQVTPRAGEERTVDRYQVHARATWLAYWPVTHVMEAGVDSEWLVHERPGAKTPGQVFSGYVQDSAFFGNRLTLNVGARYDVQRIEEAGQDPITRARLSPRVGLIVDPWGNGRMKVFAHYGKFQGLIPLGLLDAPAPTEDVTVDPDLEPLSSREVVAGLEYEVLRNVVLGATYTHRRLENGLALVPRADGGGVVLGNPGSGLASDSPRAVRNQDAVTMELRIPYRNRWVGQASYTWSKLTGNYVSPFSAWDGLTPRQRLPLDRPHVLRILGARQFDLDRLRKWRADVGASYLGASGLLLESGERTPWVHSFDVYLGARYAVRKEQDVAFRLDVFNVLNAQEPAQVEQRDTALEPVRYQAPRQVRLGVRYEF